MINQQAIDKILNKQFKKTAFAGYDTIDVDSFFDSVIEYLKSNDRAVDEYKAQLDNVSRENKKLVEQITSLNQQIAQLKQQVITFLSEGYGNVITNKRMSEIEQKLRKWEEDKKNGK